MRRIILYGVVTALCVGCACPTRAAVTAILTVEWREGGTEVIPAATLSACEEGKQALMSGRWRADGHPLTPLSARCGPGNAFAPGWDCIEGFNCGDKR